MKRLLLLSSLAASFLSAQIPEAAPALITRTMTVQNALLGPVNQNFSDLYNNKAAIVNCSSIPGSYVIIVGAFTSVCSTPGLTTSPAGLSTGASGWTLGPSNSTPLRANFTPNVSNSSMSIEATPSGTATGAAFRPHNSPDPSNFGGLYMGTGGGSFGSTAFIITQTFGTGLPITSLQIGEGSGGILHTLTAINFTFANTIRASILPSGLNQPLTTPASSSAAGVAGTILWDANFLYICTATNTWKRVPLPSGTF